MTPSGFEERHNQLNGVQGLKRPRVQAPKGRYIPAQGGGDWRAFFARRVAAALGYVPKEDRALKGRDISAAVPPNPGFDAERDANICGAGRQQT